MLSRFPIWVLTALAMMAFAGNSVLARLALRAGEIDAGSFTLIRIVSGALILVLLIKGQRIFAAGSWRGALALLVYAACFSWAYLSLSAATGALILFAAVQISMLGAGYAGGERMRARQWGGAVLAMAGLVYLLLPGIDAPPLWGAGLMIGSGLGWGLYSILGRGQGDPLAQTAGNFVRAVILCGVAAAVVLALSEVPKPTPQGMVCAVISGAVTSGLGYALWYAALKGLRTSTAGLIQLSVPVLTAFAGVILLDEAFGWRLALASLLILFGLLLALRPAVENQA